jgi:DNA-binding NarL/FixJ family response regulator
MQPLFDPRTDALDLGELWHALKAGSVCVTETACGEGRCYASLSCRTNEPRMPRAHDLLALERVLAGELGKVVASELGVSISTVSNHCSKALLALGARSATSRVPIVLVTSALCARGWRLPPARVEQRSEGALIVSFELPGKRLMSRLTRGEAEVLRMTIEGKTHLEIARDRGRSRRTVANQLAAIFRKLGVSGRAALRAFAVEDESRDWCSRPGHDGATCA